MKYVHLLFLLSLGDLFAQQVPPSALNLQQISAPRIAKAAEAALLLTPQQIAALNAEWRKVGEIIARVQTLGRSATDKDIEIRETAIRSFSTFKDSILNSDQQEINLLIVNIVSNTKKTLQMEYDPRFDSAATSTEKAAMHKQYRDDLERILLEDIKSALPPERRSAFETALGK